MIPSYQGRQVESSGVSDMASFGISQGDSAHIMNILRDTLYSDKVLAVLREYSANAWDAHNMIGKGNVPIKIVLPTNREPTLVIKDYGPGISHEDVFRIYTQYGASTKRTSNVAVGQLGIGSKSGFAYSDSFTVTSCNGGKQRTYVAVLDETEKGVINLLDEQDCGDETGITIQIPVKLEDIPEFLSKAENLFKFFVPRPDINVYLPPEIPTQARLKAGILYDVNRHDGGEWLAVMGCIPYRLNLDQVNVTDNADDKTGVGYWVHKLSGILYFDIGEVHISASREELKYSKSTKQTIIRRFSELVDEFVTSTINAIRGDTMSSWDKRLRSQILTKFDLPIPEDGKDLTRSYIEIQEKPEDFAKTFKFLSKDEGLFPLKRFPIYHDTRVVLTDDPRKLSGFHLDYHDLMLHKTDAAYSWEVVLQELDQYLKNHKLDGVPVTKLSEQTWTAPFVKIKPKKVVNPKYLRRSFFMDPSANGYYAPYSKYWEPTDATRVATDEDVFVLIEGFKTDDRCGFDLFRAYEQDKDMMEFFGLKMPTIYGYKTSDKKPLAITDCAGTYYPEWKKKIVTTLVTEKAKPYIETYDWQRRYDSSWNWGKFRLNMRAVGEGLGRDHIIYAYLKKVNSANKLWNKFKGERQSVIRNLASFYYKQDPSDSKSESKAAMNATHNRYPLLPISALGIASLWGPHKTQWVEYIQLIDRATPMALITLTPASVDEKEDDDDG